jgi:ribosomal protein L12E/L44/L45/RPP1/RPP2
MPLERMGRMEYVHTVCLLDSAGKSLTEANIRAVLHAAGTTVVESRIRALTEALKDVDLQEVTGSDGGGAGPYVYAGLLLNELDQPITEKNLRNVLNAAGVSVVSSRVKALVASFENVDIDEAIEEATVDSDTDQSDSNESTEEVTKIYEVSKASDTKIFEPPSSEDTEDDGSTAQPSYCPSCGHELADYDTTAFCPNCGYDIN